MSEPQKHIKTNIVNWTERFIELDKLNMFKLAHVFLVVESIQFLIMHLMPKKLESLQMVKETQKIILLRKSKSLTHVEELLNEEKNYLVSSPSAQPDHLNRPDPDPHCRHLNLIPFRTTRVHHHHFSPQIRFLREVPLRRCHRRTRLDGLHHLEMGDLRNPVKKKDQK